MPNTPFAAILAKETIKDQAISRTGGWVGNKIGVAGSHGVREVSFNKKFNLTKSDILLINFLCATILRLNVNNWRLPEVKLVVCKRK